MRDTEAFAAEEVWRAGLMVPSAAAFELATGTLDDSICSHRKRPLPLPPSRHALVLTGVAAIAQKVEDNRTRHDDSSRIPD